MGRTLGLAAILVLVGPALASAQASDGASSSSPGQTRAAGMALHDGTLPPGTLTVRVVRGNFSGNLAAVAVRLDTIGQPVREATTGADGRAQFAHLTVGTTVRVSATVDGERLESDTIVLPPESGVRVLLVAGDEFVDTTRPGEVAQLPPLAEAAPLAGAALPATPPPTGAPAGPSAAGPPADDAVSILRTVMIALTVLAFAAVAYGQRRRRPWRS